MNWRKDTSLAPAGIRAPECRDRSLVTRLNEVSLVYSLMVKQKPRLSVVVNSSVYNWAEFKIQDIEFVPKF